MEDKFKDKNADKFEKRMVIGAMIFIGVLALLFLFFKFVIGL